MRPVGDSVHTSEFRSGSETEHNLDCAETDVGPIEAHVCAQCQLDPPDGREQQRQLSAGESLWLHAHCEDAFIRRRMSEEGIDSSPATSAEKPGPSPSAPPPQRINGSNPRLRRWRLCSPGSPRTAGR